MSQLSEEQKERLKQVRERQARSARPDRDDVPQRDADPLARALSRELRQAQTDRGFLLSLLAGRNGEQVPSVLWVSPNSDQSGCFDAHTHKHYNNDVRYLRGDDFNASYTDLLRAASLREQKAATLMRDKCLVHLQTTADALDVRQETECPSGTAFNSEAALRRRIAAELKSLTLDQVKPGEK